MSYCRWFGVTCDSASKRGGAVIEIKLGSNSLHGQLLDTVWFITIPKHLLRSMLTHTHNNDTPTGQLPTAIGDLSTLTSLELQSNQLTGEHADFA